MKTTARLLLIFSLLLLVGSIALAQDVTSEATLESTPAATTVAPGDVTVINNPASSETPSTTTEVEVIGFAKLLSILGTVLFLGTKALNLISTYLESKKSDASFVTGAELAGKYTPGFIKDGAKGLVKAWLRLGGNLQELLDEATDDVPYVVKVHPQLPTSGAATTTQDKDVPTTPVG